MLRSNEQATPVKAVGGLNVEVIKGHRAGWRCGRNMYISNSFVISLQFIVKTKSSEAMAESNDVYGSKVHTKEYMKMFGQKKYKGAKAIQG